MFACYYSVCVLTIVKFNVNPSTKSSCTVYTKIPFLNKRKIFVVTQKQRNA